MYRVKPVALRLGLSLYYGVQTKYVYLYTLDPDFPIQHNQEQTTYFSLVSDFVRRVKTSSNITFTDAQDPNYTIGQISDEKLEVYPKLAA